MKRRRRRSSLTGPPDRILTAARELMQPVGGPASISMRNLSMASGESYGGIYHWFGSRGGVLAHLTRQIAAEYREQVFYDRDRRTIVAAHMAWTESNTPEARLFLDQRTMPKPDWLDDIDHAMLIAPAQRVCELWLGGRLPGRPSDYAERLSRS